MEKKEAVIKYIEQAKALVYDSNTFLKVRVERLAYLSEGLGGGNLLITLGLFSTLSYLAKIYVLLNRDFELFTSEELKEAKEAYNKMDKKFQRYFIPKKKDYINETEAFKKLLSNSDCPQNLGITEDEYAKIYHDIRDHLAHRIVPKYGYTMITFQADENHEIPYGDFKKAIDESNKPVFGKKDELLVCYVDFLGRDVEKISDWLINKVKNDEFTQENIDITFSWLSNG